MNTELAPKAVIFLDIDGVVYNSRWNENKAYRKVKELFPEEKIHSNKMSSQAAAHFFDANALLNLDELISKVGEVFQIQIVISSDWRENRTVEELKTEIFHIHKFSKYIVDKTMDRPTLKAQDIKKYCSDKVHEEESHSQCRSSEIQFWLKDHPDVTNYVVLDDKDDHLTLNFKERFIKTDFNTLLTNELALQAFNIMKSN